MNLTKKFLWTWKAVGGQLLLHEVAFHPLRRWRFDFAHWDSGVAIELEGGLWTCGRHNQAAGMIKDIEKYNEAALLGWTVIRLHQGNINVQYMERIKEFIDKRTNNDQRNQGNDEGAGAGQKGGGHRAVQGEPGEVRVRAVPGGINKGNAVADGEETGKTAWGETAPVHHRRKHRTKTWLY